MSIVSLRITGMIAAGAKYAVKANRFEGRASRKRCALSFLPICTDWKGLVLVKRGRWAERFAR